MQRPDLERRARALAYDLTSLSAAVRQRDRFVLLSSTLYKLLLELGIETANRSFGARFEKAAEVYHRVQQGSCAGSEYVQYVRALSSDILSAVLERFPHHESIND